MNTLEAEREKMLEQVLAARTPEAIAAAERLLDNWIAAHPEELGMRDAFEILENRKEILEARVREEPELVKAA
jgi:hypothetical protein